MENSQMPTQMPTQISRMSLPDEPGFPRQSSAQRALIALTARQWTKCLIRVVGVCFLNITGVAIADVTPTGDVRILMMPDIASPNNDRGPLAASTSDVVLEDDYYVALGLDADLRIDLGTRLVAGAMGANPLNTGLFTLDVSEGGLLELVSFNAAATTGSRSNIFVDGDGSLMSVEDDMFIGVGSGADEDLELSDGGLLLIHQTGAFSNITNLNFIDETAGLYVGVNGGTGSFEMNSNAQLVMEVDLNWSEDSLLLAAGLDGTGSIVIESGATVGITDLSTDGVDYILIGQSGDNDWLAGPADGSMVIQGAGTAVSINSFEGGIDVANSFIDGGSAVGTVDVLDGAMVQINGFGTGGIVIGRGGLADGSMTISGAGTTVDVTGGIALVLVGDRSPGRI